MTNSPSNNRTQKMYVHPSQLRHSLAVCTFHGIYISEQLVVMHAQVMKQLLSDGFPCERLIKEKKGAFGRKKAAKKEKCHVKLNGESLVYGKTAKKMNTTIKVRM